MRPPGSSCLRTVLAAATALMLAGAADVAYGQAPQPGSRTVVIEGAGRYANVGPQEFAPLVSRPGVVLVNVHVPYEGEIEGTDVHVPFDAIETHLARLPADRAAPLALYCMSGRMSTIAAETLVRLGYTDIVHLDGGMLAWDRAGYPLVGWRR
jgi:phage shock protein E